jgi:hypothetical protein
MGARHAYPPCRILQFNKLVDLIENIILRFRIKLVKKTGHALKFLFRRFGYSRRPLEHLAPASSQPLLADGKNRGNQMKDKSAALMHFVSLKALSGLSANLQRTITYDNTLENV